ncbi:HEPN domain-containing protein [Candidatus Gottesmanbacteria bacterium]|nr:HEPN domain-containing protein [Candidatus Gottesmanbacteria bacterium]
MRRDVDIWWRQAKEDLDTAFANYKIGKYYVCAFYSQQAVYGCKKNSGYKSNNFC